MLKRSSRLSRSATPQREKIMDRHMQQVREVGGIRTNQFDGNRSNAASTGYGS